MPTDSALTDPFIRDDDGRPKGTFYPVNFVCECACPDGPCEHEFKGWREFADGRGGEAVCRHCGLGAMTHSLRTGP